MLYSSHHYFNSLGFFFLIVLSITNIQYFDHFYKIFLKTLGTQRVISFLRQIVEHGGFYRTTDQAWVTIERIQFVGACNPPTDPGRKPLSHRLVLYQTRLT